MKAIWIDDDKHQQMRIEAAKKGLTILEIFNNLYENYFKKNDVNEINNENPLLNNDEL